MEHLQHLNRPQYEAVTHKEGPLLIVAGAGSGKTRVLTYRIAHLIHGHGVPPYRILAVTFTNKAAEEMQERVETIVGHKAKQVWVSTFHSACVQILRQEAQHIGYGRNFLIFDSSDQRTVIKDCLKELNLDPKQFEPRAVLGTISGAKNELLGPEAYDKQAGDFWENTVARVYRRYQAKLAENNAMDFDDLIRHTVYLWRQNPDVLKKYQERFQYILVDEYQDTNHAQYVLVNLLAQGCRNLCVVGDEDQSIYGFRGADIRNILDFEKDYPEAKVVKLEENYRSSRTILDAANVMIANNESRKEKSLWTQRPAGKKISFYRARDEREEAKYAADVIQTAVDQGQRRYSDFTMLYRVHAQSRTLEDAFLKRGIPYRIVSGVRFYERKEIKDVLAYLRLMHNPMDNYAFRRVVNVPRRGIGESTIAKIEEFALSQGLSLYEALEHTADIPKLSARFRTSLQNFFRMMNDLRSKVEQLDLATLTQQVLQQTGYEQTLQDEGTYDAQTRLENVKEFISVARQYEKEYPGATLEGFLEHVALFSDADNYDQGADVVHLMTFHAAKGLEFPVVFLVGMEEGIFPHARSLREPGQMEEERRLAYVGLTRAEEELYVTCAQIRTLYGSQEQNPVSSFLQEIPAELMEDRSESGLPREPARRRETAGSMALYDEQPTSAGNAAGSAANGRRAPVASFAVGDRIRHPKWGDGMVVSVKAYKGDLELDLAFPSEGIKKVLASIAPIEKI